MYSNIAERANNDIYGKTTSAWFLQTHVSVVKIRIHIWTRVLTGDLSHSFPSQHLFTILNVKCKEFFSSHFINTFDDYKVYTRDITVNVLSFL